MRILLDTQAFLVVRSGGGRLPARARRAFLDPENELFLSPASVWEMAIKCSLGKLHLGIALPDLVRSALSTGLIRPLPIDLDHLYAVKDLPFHHRDPFDRLLVAQARCEELAILGGDDAFDAYGVNRIW